MEKLGASHSSDSLRSKRVKYTRKEYVSTSYLRLLKVNVTGNYALFKGHTVGLPIYVDAKNG